MISCIGEGLEENREETIFVVGVLISTLSDNMFPQVKHLCGQFTNAVATLLEGNFLKALRKVLYIDNDMRLHQTDCDLENNKTTKDTTVFHFISVTKVLLLC